MIAADNYWSGMLLVPHHFDVADPLDIVAASRTWKALSTLFGLYCNPLSLCCFRGIAVASQTEKELKLSVAQPGIHEKERKLSVAQPGIQVERYSYWSRLGTFAATHMYGTLWEAH